MKEFKEFYNLFYRILDALDFLFRVSIIWKTWFRSFLKFLDSMNFNQKIWLLKQAV